MFHLYFFGDNFFSAPVLSTRPILQRFCSIRPNYLARTSFSIVSVSQVWWNGTMNVEWSRSLQTCTTISQTLDSISECQLTDAPRDSDCQRARSDARMNVGGRNRNLSYGRWSQKFYSDRDMTSERGLEGRFVVSWLRTSKQVWESTSSSHVTIRENRGISVLLASVGRFYN